MPSIAPCTRRKPSAVHFDCDRQKVWPITFQVFVFCVFFLKKSFYNLFYKFGTRWTWTKSHVEQLVTHGLFTKSNTQWIMENIYPLKLPETALPFKLPDCGSNPRLTEKQTRNKKDDSVSVWCHKYLRHKTLILVLLISSRNFPSNMSARERGCLLINTSLRTLVTICRAAVKQGW